MLEIFLTIFIGVVVSSLLIAYLGDKSVTELISPIGFIFLNLTIVLFSAIHSFRKHRDLISPMVVFPVLFIIMIYQAANLSNAFDFSIIKQMLLSLTVGTISFVVGNYISEQIPMRPLASHINIISLQRIKKSAYLLIMIPAIFIFYSFIKFGQIPMFSANPQLVRFTILSIVGNYISTFYVLLIPAGIFLTIGYRQGEICKKRYYILVLFILILYLSLGFRSRMIYFLIGVEGYAHHGT